VKGIIQTLLPYCGTFIAFFLLYFSLPNCKVPKSSAAIGALVATVLFEIARYGFAIYVTTFTNYRLVYGALAVLPTFLAWLYITWLVILFGVVISYILTQRAQ
jgi:membrane protein